MGGHGLESNYGTVVMFLVPTLKTVLCLGGNLYIKWPIASENDTKFCSIRTHGFALMHSSYSNIQQI